MFKDKRECPKCLGANWICEAHPHKAWGGVAVVDQKSPVNAGLGDKFTIFNTCFCPGPGMPCDVCGGDFEERDAA